MSRSRVRYLMVIVAACTLTGCAADVTMMNPHTGEKVVCRETLRGLDPWSQKEACVGYYAAAGWVRANQDQP